MLARKNVFGVPIAMVLMAVVITAAMVAANSVATAPAEASVSNPFRLYTIQRGETKRFAVDSSWNDIAIDYIHQGGAVEAKWKSSWFDFLMDIQNSDDPVTLYMTIYHSPDNGRTWNRIYPEKAFHPWDSPSMLIVLEGRWRFHVQCEAGLSAFTLSVK